MNECIFCRIIAGEIPTEYLYQDDLLVAFRDINPVAPVHLLLVPRRHLVNMLAAGEGDWETLARLQGLAARLAHDAGIAESGFRLVCNNGPDAGQEIPHLHFHLLGGKKLGSEL